MVVLKVGYAEIAAAAAVEGGAVVDPAQSERDQNEKHFLWQRLKLNEKRSIKFTTRVL